MTAVKSNRQTIHRPTPIVPSPDGPTFAARLREITRGLVVETDSPDPHVIAAAVMERLTSRQYREALAVCLPNWVRIEIAQRRPAAPAPKPGRSKSADVRDYYTRLMSKAMFNGIEWKFLRNCTAEDLFALARQRYEQAAATQAEGQKWEKVAAFMDEHGRATVADLTADELKTLLEASS